MKYCISFFLIFYIAIIGVAQESSELGDIYFEKGDYEKAEEYYKTAARKEDPLKIYERYRSTLIKLHEYKELVKFIEDIEDKQYIHNVDLVLAYRALDDQKDAKKLRSQITREAKASEYEVQKLYDALEKRGETEWAAHLITEYRDFSNDEFAFADLMAQLSYKQGNTELMLKEYTIYVQNRPEMMEYVLDNLQQKLKANDYKTYEDILYAKIGEENELVYHELLSWIYIQRRDFYNAFVEEKSIDLNKNLQAQRLFDLAQVTLENGKYDLTKQIYEYVAIRYKDTQVGETASERLLEVKEVELRKTYPVDTMMVTQLINELYELRNITHRVYQRNDITLKIARLKAYYLGEIKSAIALLEELLQRPVGSQRSFFISVKIELADLYLYDDQPWEAVLLYGQAASEGKESDLAHLAKLKTAQLYYYEADFELAKEYLDILKLATSREIANDALDLFILIQDNLALDTSSYALQQYALSEKLLYQKNYGEALANLNKLENTLSMGHSLTDEIDWLKSSIYLSTGRREEAIASLNKVLKGKKDIYTDNALITLAHLYEENGDIAEAKKYYKEILLKHSGSIFTAEARKKFRSLRENPAQN